MDRLDRHLWTREQRGVLCLFLLALCAFLAFRLLRDRQFVPQQQPDEGPRAHEVDNQLDLNSADADQLSAIPRLGQVKAQAIVAYREHFVATHPGKRAFDELEDAYRIKGIGPSTMELLRQYAFVAKATTKP
jgi:DNA uptake protein ComE-like DNA-binding protein